MPPKSEANSDQWGVFAKMYTGSEVRGGWFYVMSHVVALSESWKHTWGVW